MSLQIWMPMTDGTSANQGLMDATIENTKIVANANGKLGKCCEFNGTDSRILINGDFGKTVLGGEWTVCMWIYDTKGAARGSYFTTYGITPGISTGLSIEKTAAKALRVYWNASPDWNTGYTIPDEQWFHLAVVHKEESCYIYVNGEFITSRSNGFKVVSVGNYTKAAIGRDYRTTTPAHKGRIQDFRFYTSALSDRQIKKISQGLVMHFSLSGYGVQQENLLIDSLNIGMTGSDGTYKTIRTFDEDTHIGTVQVSDTSHSQNSWRFLSANLGGASAITAMTTGEYTYTFSCDIRVTNYTTGNIRVGFEFRSPNPIQGVVYLLQPNEFDGNWHRISMTVSGNDSQKAQALWSINTAGTAHGSMTIIQYKNPKLEVGDRATAWTPNPADDLYSYYTDGSTIEYDLSGNGYDAIKNNITQDYNTPRNVSCAVFNGTDSWIKIQTNSWMVQRSPELTISFWAYSDDWKTKYTRMFSCTESGGFNTEKGTTGYMRFVIDVYTTEASSSRAYQYSNASIKLSDLSAGWHMFSFVYDASSGNKVYVDGALIENYEAVSYGTHFNTTNCFLYLGCEANYKNPYTPFFNGKMSDFRIYYTALPADEIKLLYDGDLSNNGLSGGDTE